MNDNNCSTAIRVPYFVFWEQCDIKIEFSTRFSKFINNLGSKSACMFLSADVPFPSIVEYSQIVQYHFLRFIVFLLARFGKN